jgi:hypothetical protein
VALEQNHSRLPSEDKRIPEAAMKAFLAACVALTVIAVCAAVVLDKFNKPVDEAFASEPSVRI